jgi:hypothetical protein
MVVIAHHGVGVKMNDDEYHQRRKAGAILNARMHRIGILMWLESAGKFYWFDPSQLDKEGERNMKGQSVMVNFKISLGKSPW